jgi:hypothetical protein
MDRRTFIAGIVFLTTGCITDRIAGTDRIVRQNLTKSHDRNPDSDRENDLPKAVFDPEKNEVTITTVLGVEACNEAFIKRSTYNSDSRTLTVTFGDKRREEVSSSSGCAGAVALDVYVAKIVLENDISLETVVIVSDGQETTIDSISS